MDKTDWFRTIVPAIISIAILVHFQYFHNNFISHFNTNQDTDIPINFSKNIEDSDRIEAHLSKKILNTLAIIFHVHLNKLLIMLVMIIILNKVSL